LSITHHTRKRPSTGPRTTHGPQRGANKKILRKKKKKMRKRKKEKERKVSIKKKNDEKRKNMSMYDIKINKVNSPVL
jgi:hypothetical protein